MQSWYLEMKRLGYAIYKLNTALLPNETIEVTINSNYAAKGFENESAISGVYNNGTFLNNFQILPYLGYNSSVEISDKNTRKKYDLVSRIRTPKLEENCSDKCMINYLSNGKSDFINIETVISTANDQIAIAPGSLIKNWEEGDRKYFHYKVDHPSQHFCNFISAKYEKAVRKWKGIDIEVYHDKKHEVNVERMLEAVERFFRLFYQEFWPLHAQAM